MKKQFILQSSRLPYKWEDEPKKPRIPKVFITEEILPDGTIAIGANGIQTTIKVYEKSICGELMFVTKIHRYYPNGLKHEEPEHLWTNPLQARLDAKDWVALAKMTDW